MRRFIVGTAGHIDHGKSALVRALTGTDPDRLPEEKARGITIDLGFASLEDGENRLGLVDVPGHERFVRNMIAGAGGIDAVLLVVAADEGVQPQTREHFAIVKLLGIGSGLVALTKIDRADPERLRAARAQVEELVEGSFLEATPVLPVSARTGEGIAELRAALLSLPIAQTPERRGQPLRMPVDRAFAMPGFGPVVTGSVVSGTIRPEDRVEVLPEGLIARARRVEIHGREVAEAAAGERTSINLAGVSLDALHRGQILATPGALIASSRLLAQVELLDGAGALRNAEHVTVYHYAAEIQARVRLLEGDRLEPGGRALAILTLAHPVAAAVEDRFVLRRPSPPESIGGGEVRDCHPPRRLAAADREAFGGGDRARRLARRIERRREGVALSELAREEFVSEADVRRLLAPAVEAATLISTAAPEHYLSNSTARSCAAAVTSEIDAARLRPGVAGALRAIVLEKIFPRFDRRVAEHLLARMAAAGEIEDRGETLSRPGADALPPAANRLAERLLARFDMAGLDPPAPRDLVRELGAKDKIVEGLIHYLVREKRLAKLPGGLIVSRRAVDGVAERLRASGRDRISVPEFKEMFGLTRRLAIPLLEHLDERKITRRSGDAREVLR